MFGSPVENELTEVALMVRDPVRTKAKPHANKLPFLGIPTHLLPAACEQHGAAKKSDLITQVLLTLCRDGKGYSAIDLLPSSRPLFSRI